jgi:Protein of unknown function (DUF3253)
MEKSNKILIKNTVIPTASVQEEPCRGTKRRSAHEEEGGTDSRTAKAQKINKSPDLSERIREAILNITAKRGTSKTCCPSEIPRVALGLANWREHMDMTREIAFDLARSGKISVLQKGIVVQPESFGSLSGPIRLSAFRGGTCRTTVKKSEL